MGVSVGSLDLPDQPDEPKRAEHGDASRLTPKPRELPDPDERGRHYEAMQAQVPDPGAAERPDQLSAPEHCREGAGQLTYRDEMPKLVDMWADHVQRWPTRQRAATDHSDDPPECGEAIGRVREAEKGLSSNAEGIEQQNDHGGRLEGFEHRLKGEDRLRQKMAEKLEVEPSKTPAEALHQVGDAIRYTYCFQPENYTRGYYDIKERLEGCGYEMYYSKNHWTNSEYKGINTRWVTPEGQRFEVQFHTPDSFHAKHNVTHAAYERIRDPATRKAELRELHAFQARVWALVEAPDRATGIPDYEKEGF